MLIMDEMSTTDAKFIGMMDIALRELKNRPDERFGGIHMLFVGDWLQQLPVAGHPAFQCQTPPPVTSKTKRKYRKDDDANTYLLRQRGVISYQEINEVVILEENMRHRNDPQWRDILDRWRVGDYRQEDIDIVNACCYKNTWPTNVLEEEKTFCPIIVTSNALRVEFNDQATTAYCKQTHRDLHYFPAEVSRPRSQLSRTQRRSLQRVRNDKTGGLSIVMKVAVGMPVQCTKNTSRALHLSNGTIGNVVGIQPSTKTLNENGVNIHIHAKPADTIFIKLRAHEFRAKRILHCTPSGVVPVRCRDEKSVDIQMQNRNFSLRIKQVPLVPAFGLTTEKCQGLTVERLIMGPLRHSTRNAPQPSSFYVAVTRVKMMKELYLMEKLTLKFLKYVKPGEAAMRETRRLHEFEMAHE